MSKEVNIKITNKEDILRLLKQYGAHNDMADTHEHSDICSKNKIKRIYERIH